MKKNKLIGLLVAVCGAAVSIGTASALYYKNMTQPIGFSIGDATWQAITTGEITYQINQQTSGSVSATYLDADGHQIVGAEGLGGSARQACYMFPVGAVFNDGHPQQNFVVGNFSATLSGFNTALKGKASVYVNVEGYTPGTLGAHYYATAFGDDAAIDANGTTIIKKADIAVTSSGLAQSVRVLVKLNDGEVTDDATRFAVAEQSLCTLSVTWGEPEDFGFAHVVNNDDLWNEQEYYNMAPNIEFNNNNNYTDEFEWTYNGFTGHSQAKCRKGNQWSADMDTESKNNELTSNFIYDVYWQGEGHQAVFQKTGEQQ